MTESGPIPALDYKFEKQTNSYCCKYEFNDNTSVILSKRSKFNFSEEPFEFNNSCLDPYLIGVSICCKCKNNTLFHKRLNTIRDLKNKYYPVEIVNGKLGKILTKSDYPNIFWQDLKKMKLNCRLNLRFIPENYLYSSFQDRMELLEGILDINGKFNKTYYINCCSPILAKEIAFLIRSLGGFARISEYETRTPYYKITFYLKNLTYTKEIRKKVKSVEEVGKLPCVCIKAKSLKINDFLEVS